MRYDVGHSHCTIYEGFFFTEPPPKRFGIFACEGMLSDIYELPVNFPFSCFTCNVVGKMK